MTRIEIAWIAGAYLIGSVPTGYWLGKYWKGVDVREHGSGNLGATNVYRVLGAGAGSITLVIDILKGLVPVLWCQHLFPPPSTLPVAVGLAAIVGHCTSVFVRFQGGKGVATSAGVFVALLPVPAGLAIGIFLLAFAVTRIVSLCSILAAIGLAVSALWWAPEPLLKYASMAIAIFVIWTHRANIKRLMNGTEKPLRRTS